MKLRATLVVVLASAGFSACCFAPAGESQSEDGGVTSGGGSGGTTGGGTTGGSITSGTSTASTSGSGTTGGANSGGSTSSGSSSGGTGGTPWGDGGCAPGATWQGDICTVASCANQPDQATCALAGGGLGQCLGGSCGALMDLTSDPSNCGFFGAVCPTGWSCSNSICHPKGIFIWNCATHPPCPVGTSCLQMFTRDNHPHLACVPPTCGTKDGPTCQVNGTPGTCCSSGSCVDTQNDPLNCGGCAVDCGAGFCDRGVCQPRPDCSIAPLGTHCGFVGGVAQECCGGACMDLRTDIGNCGSCGFHCIPGTTCAGGRCSAVGVGKTFGCDAGLTLVFDGEMWGCVAATCTADDDGLWCAQPNWAAGGVCCKSACLAPLVWDSANCGFCGHACGAGAQCIQGMCQPALSFDCAQDPGGHCTFDGGSGTCCGGGCVDITTDAKNCSQCGSECPVGSSCVGQNCALADGGYGSWGCGPDDPCPTGTTCFPWPTGYTSGGGTCYGSSCNATQQGQLCAIVGAGPPVLGVCCNEQCADLSSDSNNCHSCGSVCPPGSTCQGRSCKDSAGGAQPCVAGTCSPGFNCVGSYCAAIDCTAKNNLEACSYGPGVGGSCCNGVCVDFRQAGNCKACGSDCPSGICTSSCLTQPTSDCPATCPAGAICISGQCVNGLCFASGASCATAAGAVGYCCGDRACADLANDPDSCGTCDVHCPAGQTCSGGVCSGGDMQCTGRAGGYCTIAAGSTGVCCGGGCRDVSTDAKNCGACGNDCGALNCTSGVCG